MTLRYLLDTNICIYIANQKPKQVLQKFEQLAVSELAMSIITYGELVYGIKKSKHPKKNQLILETLLSYIPPLPMPTNAGEYYGEIRVFLENRGKSIGNNDLWIAAHALALGVTLVTNNTKEFSCVPHLKVENWVSE